MYHKSRALTFFGLLLLLCLEKFLQVEATISDEDDERIQQAQGPTFLQVKFGFLEADIKNAQMFNINVTIDLLALTQNLTIV